MDKGLRKVGYIDCDCGKVITFDLGPRDSEQGFTFKLRAMHKGVSVSDFYVNGNNIDYNVGEAAQNVLRTLGSKLEALCGSFDGIFDKCEISGWRDADYVLEQIK